MARRTTQIIARIQKAMRAADTIDEALLSAVRATCISCRLPYGEVWQSYTGRSVLYLKDTWSQPDLDFADFITASKKFAFVPGVGVPGRVWKSRQSEFVGDLLATPELSRQTYALAAGFRAAAGLPALRGEEVVAVLVFLMFKDERRRLLSIERIAEAVGTELSERWSPRSGSVNTKTSLLA